MFKFLKEKLKGAISKFSKRAVEEPKEEALPQQPIEGIEKKAPIIKETKALEQENIPLQKITEKENAHEKPEEATVKFSQKRIKIK